ncbi:hypothetical protein D7X96_21010 [Corallococcus interemptor]|uniref:Lipoprotein n=1 Tax=Corallococcus interemptor TaxID=2316720 RepID=A0A3A8QUD8_9BACT|nr:hypothetical protein [Corallococcus interemptor]RKH49790.1 hypothetical protein D7Y23_15550 [Corallococcus sp. AB050B]RKH66714.1 hypothetical protein D7X96_21010 [Corallococcus interemptor]
MLRRVGFLPLVLLLVVFAGCSRCGKEAAGPADSPRGVSRYLPRTAQAAVVIDDLGTLGEKLARFQNLKVATFVAQLQNFSSAERYVSAVMRQVGVDLRSRKALEDAGIDPKRGAGAAFLGGTQAVSVIGVKDADKLKTTFATFARSRLGASEEKDTKVDAGRLVTFNRPGSTEPMLGMLFLKHDLVLLSAGAAVPRLTELAALPEEQSLSKEPVLEASLKRLSGDRDFHVWLPGGMGLLPAGSVQGITFTGHIEDRAVTLRADAPWPDTQVSLAALEAKGGESLAGWLPQDSFFVARFRGDPSQLDGVWPYLAGSQVTRAVQEAGFNVKAEVLDNLKPGMALSLSLAPNVNLSSGMPDLDLRRTNPFRFVNLVALAEVKDVAKGQATLEKVPGFAGGFGAKVEATDLSGQKAYLTSYRAGEGAHFALSKDGKLVLAAPKARLESTLASFAQPAGAGPVSEDLKAVGKDAALVVLLDLRRLSDAVKALPSAAWGIGGFAIKATTVRWLDATDDLRAVTMALSRKDKALQAEISLRLTPAPAASTTTTTPATP